MTRKPLSLRGGLGSSSLIWDWHWIWPCHFTPVWQRVKIKSQKVLGTNSYVCRSYRRKTGRMSFCPLVPPSWILLKGEFLLHFAHKKLRFPLWTFSLNITKSTASCGFGHIYWKSSYGKLHFLCTLPWSYKPNFLIIDYFHKKSKYHWKLNP